MSLPLRARVYLWVVVLVAAGMQAYWFQAWSAPVVSGLTDLGLMALLVALATVAQHYPLMVGPRRKVNVAIAVYFACVLLFGAPAAMALVGASQLLGQSTLALRRNPTSGKRMRTARSALFNTGQFMITTGLGGLVYYSLLPHLAPAPLERVENLWAVPAAGATMYLANTLLVAAMVGLQRGQRLAEVWFAGRRIDVLQLAGLFLSGLVALSSVHYPWTLLVMALPTGIVYLSLRRMVQLLAGEQAARVEAEAVRQRLAFLAEASSLLAASLDYEATLTQVARLAVPTLANWCAIHIVEESGAISRLAVAHAEPAGQEVAEELQRRSFIDFDPGDPMLRVLRTGRSEFHREFPEECLRDTAGSATPLQALRDPGCRRAMTVPLVARERTLGALTFVAVATEPSYGPADLALAEDLARRVASAVDNARLYRAAQQEIAERTQVEQALRQSEARFRRLTDHAPDLIYRYELRPRRCFSYVSPAATPLMGYTPDEHYADPDLALKLVHLDDRALLEALLAGRPVTQPLVIRWRHKEGQIVWTEQRIVSIHDGDGNLLAIEGVSRDVTERKRVEEQARLAAERLAEQSKVLALLEERERIAMDLHDGVIQSLYAVALGLGARTRTLDGNAGELREALRQAMVQMNGIIQEIRNYIFDLRPQELETHGLRSGLEMLAEELRVNGLIHAELELLAETEGLLNGEAGANLLHFAREATANVIRHAQASTVTIRLVRVDDKLRLTISDNGRGFDRALAERGGGNGLRNMAERARILGGRLAVTTQPGRGTEVRLMVPLGERAVAR